MQHVVQVAVRQPLEQLLHVALHLQRAEHVFLNVTTFEATVERPALLRLAGSMSKCNRRY